MSRQLCCALAVSLLSFVPKIATDDMSHPEWESECDTKQSIYNFEVENLNGDPVSMSKYRGHVLLIVNVATFCRYTEQYKDFNPLLERNDAGGLTIVAFPCNQFHLQEPANNDEILNGLKYVRPGHNYTPHRNLHIMGKLQVNGAEHHPLFEFLKDSCPPTRNLIGSKDELFYSPIRGSDITWNFEKFLIDADGIPRMRFHPSAWTNGTNVQPHIERVMQLVRRLKL